MKRKLWLVALGLLAFALFALATLPARVVVDPLAARGVTVSGVTGTVWKGSAQVVQAGAINVGAVQWDLHALPLLTGRAVADVKITRADGFVQTTLDVASGSKLILSDLTATLPLSALPQSVGPRGWSGQLNARLATLVIENGWPTNAAGTVEVLDLVGPPRKPAAMGSYKVTFPEQSSPDVLAGALTDINGPLQIAGTLELKAADRSYVINGLASTRANASPDLAKALLLLAGEPDAQGQRPVSLGGSY